MSFVRPVQAMAAKKYLSILMEKLPDHMIAFVQIFPTGWCAVSHGEVGAKLDWTTRVSSLGVTAGVKPRLGPY